MVSISTKIVIMEKETNFVRGMIMKKKLLALLMGTSLVLTACGGADESAEKDSTSNETTTATAGDAAKLYENNCSACHGQDLAGIKGHDLNKTKLSKEEIQSIIKNGKEAMPGGLVNEDEAAQLAEWLTTKK